MTSLCPDKWAFFQFMTSPFQFFCVGVENKLETGPAAEGSEDNAA
jgi:hypothetical protein